MGRLERHETGVRGVSIVRNVPVVAATDDEGGSSLHFTGVERGLGGFDVRAFKFSDRWTEKRMEDVRNFSPDDPDFLGHHHVYASMSPVVPEEDRSVKPEGLPEPLPLSPYEVYIDLANPGELIGGRDSVDVLIVLAAEGETPTVPSNLFEFSGLSLMTSDRKT